MFLSNSQETGFMYYVKKRMEVAMAHQLTLPYESKCSRLHGHNAIITVYCCSEELNESGMVVDFKKIKNVVEDMLDHNPTAENLARHICNSIDKCYKVTFQETEGNVACYIKDNVKDLEF